MDGVGAVRSSDPLGQRWLKHVLFHWRRLCSDVAAAAAAAAALAAAAAAAVAVAAELTSERRQAIF